MNGIKTYDVEIHQMVFGGDGLARLPDGRAVFVPFTLPGEKVRIMLTEEKKKFARGSVVEILQASSQRISPRCIHFGVCGGCQYQHMSYENQLSVKQAVFTEQIMRIAGIDQPPIKTIKQSPEPWNYRNTVQFHISAAGLPGYHVTGSHEMVEIVECHLPVHGINAVWPKLAFEPDTDVERVEITEGMDEEILLTLSGDDLPPEMELDMPVSVVHLTPAEGLILAGSSYVLMQVKDHVFSVSAGSFFQVNNGLVPLMVDEVLSQLSLKCKQVVMDLYAGVGLFSAFVAPLVREVIAIEQSESACQDFAINLDQYDNISLYEGDVKTVLPELDTKPDVIIVDPPRSGLDRNVVDEILKKSPAQLVYISCDPPTLARDLKRLSIGGYQVKEIAPFDMFPQTQHIESISYLVHE